MAKLRYSPEGRRPEDLPIADIAALRHRTLMVTIRLSRFDEGKRIIEIWRDAVDTALPEAV